MDVYEYVLKVVEALIIVVICHIDQCLEDWNNHACHVHLVGVGIWPVKVVSHDEACLSRV